MHMHAYIHMCSNAHAFLFRYMFTCIFTYTYIYIVVPGLELQRRKLPYVPEEKSNHTHRDIQGYSGSSTTGIFLLDRMLGLVLAQLSLLHTNAHSQDLSKTHSLMLISSHYACLFTHAYSYILVRT